MPAEAEPVTIDVGDPGFGVAELLDEATSRIIALEARGYLPGRLRVPQSAYDRIALLRAGEIARGIPLIVLGLPLVAGEA